MPITTQSKSPAEAAAKPAEAKPRFIAVAYVPEARDPMLQEIMGGAFGVTFPTEEPAVTLLLHPGTNKVDRALWERAKATPAVQQKIEQRVIEEIEIGETDGGAPEGNAMFTIKAVENTAALKMVAFSRSIPQLESWHDTDDRMAVRGAIKRRIEALNAGTEM